MAGVLWISVTFLTGRYHGEEWPPSPARLMQAIVAGVKNGGNRASWPDVEEGLRWLERQPAPKIYARPNQQLAPYKLAVPNNDLDVIAKEWAAGRSANAAKIRTMKSVQPHLTDGPVPHVRYVWDLEGVAEAERAESLLRPAIGCLYSLGWGVDMAYAASGFSTDEDGEGWEKWLPADHGERRAIPVAGFLKDLEATYERFRLRAVGKGVDADTRLSVYGLQPYAKQGDVRAFWRAFCLRTVDGEEIFSKPWRFGMEIAAWMRHAASEALAGEDIGEDHNAFVLGHAKDSGAASHRLSFVPLPSIHPQHGDGRIRRILVVEPLGSSGRVVDMLGVKWIGKTLVSEGGRKECLLEKDDGRVTPLYAGKSLVWRSVTPVILHGYNATRGVVSVARTERLLLRAFEMAGRVSEEIESLAFQAAPLWRGAEAANAMRVPKHLDGFPRYHIEVKFRGAIEGPVLAGIGRHYGIGVFAPAQGRS